MCSSAPAGSTPGALEASHNGNCLRQMLLFSFDAGADLDQLCGNLIAVCLSDLGYGIAAFGNDRFAGLIWLLIDCCLFVRLGPWNFAAFWQ